MAVMNILLKSENMKAITCEALRIFIFKRTEAEFKEFEPRLKSAKTRFKLSDSLNLETFHAILSGTNHI